jgi:hypothetical protein
MQNSFEKSASMKIDRENPSFFNLHAFRAWKDVGKCCPRHLKALRDSKRGLAVPTGRASERKSGFGFESNIQFSSRSGVGLTVGRCLRSRPASNHHSRKVK